MTLHQWLDNSWIREIEPSKQKVANLRCIAERQLNDASVEGLSVDGQFEHAYQAVRVMCQVALNCSGFAIAKGTSEHQRVLESIKFTLEGKWVDEADYYDRCRRMRNQSLYDGSGFAREKDALELLSSAKRLNEALLLWLKEQHGSLL